MRLLLIYIREEHKGQVTAQVNFGDRTLCTTQHGLFSQPNMDHTKTRNGTYHYASVGALIELFSVRKR